MELLQVCTWIYEGCGKLDIEVSKLPKLSEANATAQADYDKALGLEVARLKAAGESVSIIDRLAKGNCSDALLAKISAEGRLKACYANIESLKARINALQSINKYLADLPVE